MKYLILLLSFVTVLSTEPLLNLPRKEAMSTIKKEGWVLMDSGKEICNDKLGTECSFVIIAKPGITKKVRFELDKVSGVVTYPWDYEESNYNNKELVNEL